MSAHSVRLLKKSNYISSCSKFYTPSQQSTEMQFSLSSDKCKASTLPQKFLILSSVRLRNVQRAQNAEGRDVGKVLLERNLLCDLLATKVMTLGKVQPSAL